MDAAEQNLIGNPADLSLCELLELARSLHQKNEEQLGRVRSTLRQYGYKGSPAPQQAPAVVEEEAAAEAEEEAAEAEAEAEAEGEAEAEASFTTPLKPWEVVEKRAAESPETPATPATPTLDSVSLTAQTRSALKTGSPKFHHQLHKSAAKKTPPKPTLRERIAELHRSTSKATPSAARASLPAASASIKRDVARGSISFATSTAFTPGASKRSYARTPGSKTPTARASLPAPATPKALYVRAKRAQRRSVLVRRSEATRAQRGRAHLRRRQASEGKRAQRRIVLLRRKRAASLGGCRGETPRTPLLPARSHMCSPAHVLARSCARPLMCSPAHALARTRARPHTRLPG
jgi:hypothetical protein